MLDYHAKFSQVQVLHFFMAEFGSVYVSRCVLVELNAPLTENWWRVE